MYDVLVASYATFLMRRFFFTSVYIQCVTIPVLGFYRKFLALALQILDRNIIIRNRLNSHLSAHVLNRLLRENRNSMILIF